MTAPTESVGPDSSVVPLFLVDFIFKRTLTCVSHFEMSGAGRSDVVLVAQLVDEVSSR